MPVVVIVVGSTTRFLGLVTLQLNSFMNLARGLAPQNQHYHYPQVPAQYMWLQHLAGSHAQSPELPDFSGLFPALRMRAFPKLHRCGAALESTCLCTADVEQPSAPHACAQQMWSSPQLHMLVHSRCGAALKSTCLCTADVEQPSTPHACAQQMWSSPRVHMLVHSRCGAALESTCLCTADVEQPSTPHACAQQRPEAGSQPLEFSCREHGAF